MKKVKGEVLSVKTRDPEPTNRDPKPEVLAEDHSRKALVCVPETEARCPKCNHVSSRIMATRTDTNRGFILRYRTCVACGNEYASRCKTDPNAQKWPAVQGIDS